MFLLFIFHSQNLAKSSYGCTPRDYITTTKEEENEPLKTKSWVLSLQKYDPATQFGTIWTLLTLGWNKAAKHTRHYSHSNPKPLLFVFLLSIHMHQDLTKRSQHGITHAAYLWVCNRNEWHVFWMTNCCL